MHHGIRWKLLVWAAAFTTVFALYYPGLSGGFMLDDFSSLPTLYQSMNACGWWCGVMTGSTGPTGRPLSLVSFALQASEWPNPYYFKLVNLLIHLVNTLLFFLIFERILKKFSKIKYPFWVAIIAAFVWATLPIQISTVLYVIQRMVLLSSMFVLMGVLYYLYFRDRLVDPKSSLVRWIICSSGLAAIGVFALIAKESGVLLLVYIIALELTLFRKSEYDFGVKAFRWAALYIPVLFLIIYLALPRLMDPEAAYLGREFTLIERLMTQGRILWEYLFNAFFPQASNLGLYHDHYRISRSLADPWTTLLAWLSLTIVFVVAVRLKNRMPMFSLGVFWFLGGHLLESTIIPLELYFEHRNYVPLAMLVLGAVAGFYMIGASLLKSRPIKAGFAIGCVFYLSLLCLTSFGQAALWGDEVRYAVVQAREHPESIRARALEVNAYSRAGYVRESYNLAQKMAEDFPYNAGLAVLSLDYHCVDRSFDLEPSNIVGGRLSEAVFGYGAIKTIGDYLNGYEAGYCNHVGPEYILELVTSLRSNPKYAKKEALLIGYQVRLLGLLGRYEDAIALLKGRAVRDEDWVLYVRYLAIEGQYARGIEVANDALEALASKPYYARYRAEIRRLREVLKDDLRQSSSL